MSKPGFNRRAILSGLMAMLVLLGGCAPALKQQSFNREAASVKRIVVLTMRSSEIDLVIVNNPGYSFGLIGALVAEANRAPKRNKLREYVSQAGFDHVETFRTQLVDELEARGYEVRWQDPVMADGKRDRVRREAYGTRKSYPAVGEADAQLDVNFGFVGYAAAGSGKSAPYRPTAVIAARLVSANGKQKLFSDTIIYNNVFGQRQAVTINPDHAFVYPDFDDLEAAGTNSVEGLRLAVASVASTLAKRL